MILCLSRSQYVTVLIPWDYSPHRAAADSSWSPASPRRGDSSRPLADAKKPPRGRLVASLGLAAQSGQALAAPFMARPLAARFRV